MRITGTDLAFALVMMLGWALTGFAVFVARNSRRHMNDEKKTCDKQVNEAK